MFWMAIFDEIADVVKWLIIGKVPVLSLNLTFKTLKKINVN